jgi:hypothetical protein
VLLTRSPLSPRPKPGFSLDLHVLSAPPAFVLSQDQTLREDCCVGKPTQTDHFELVLKVVSSPKGRDGFLGLTSKDMRSRRIRTAEFSKTDAVKAGA